MYSEFPILNYAALIEIASIDSSRLICKILTCILEALDYSFLNSPQRRSAYHVRACQPRTLTTFFGKVTYM